MNVGELFEHLDSVERKESPLTPIRPALQSNHQYIETEETCPDPTCDGSLWDKNGEKICDICSIVKDKGGTLSSPTNPWETFWENRPRYHNSNRRRQVGGFNHQWLDSDDSDEPIGLIDPTDFYLSEE